MLDVCLLHVSHQNNEIPYMSASIYTIISYFKEEDRG